MHRTSAAGGLVVLERTMMETELGIGKKVFAISAEPSLGPVSIPAKASDQNFDGLDFPLYSF